MTWSHSNVAFLAMLWTATTTFVAADEMGEARVLLLRGRYTEALEAANRLKEDYPIEASLLEADAHVAVGRLGKAAMILRKLDVDPPKPLVIRRLMQLELLGGEGSSVNSVARLLDLDPNDVQARWLHVRNVLRGSSIDEVRKSLAWFAETGPNTAPDDADEAIALALGLAEYARWSHESKWFNVAVNDVLGKAERRFPRDWRIPFERARLFAEKHNEPAAVDSLNAALAKNGNAAELHALRARFAVDKFDLDAARRSITLARKVNPELREIALVDADIAFCELRPDVAKNVLQATWESTQRRDAEVYGRMVAATKAMRQGELEESSDEIGFKGPSGALYWLTQGDAFERMRRFSQAAGAYRMALQVPEYPGVRARLAHQLLRLGEEEEGGRLLNEARKEDPFDVRVKNTIEVLHVLSTYATLETEHFLIRFDRGRDELLARYVAEYLESEVYPNLVDRFRYEPKGKSLIEIYNRARNTSGHGWFSARMVGVPGLHTIGACAGRIVALASPTDMPRPYNWARVLRHEFVHLMNLEQTDFNVPHWVTEGLAVTAEDRPRPSQWTRLLTQRYNDGDLFTLDNINFGFIRPSNSNDWTLAYAQAQLYIDFMTSRYGNDSVPRLLRAFEANASAQQAVEQATGAPAAEFEKGYRRYVGNLVDSWGLSASTSSRDIDRLEQEWKAEPDNPDRLTALAAAHFAKSELAPARKYANQAVRLAPRQPTAAYVLASLALASQDQAGAERIAKAALDPSSPHEGLLLLLVDLKLADDENAFAEKLLLLGKKHFTSLDQWNVRLARLYAKAKNDAKLEPVLIELVATQEDDPSLPAKLAELAVARKDDAAVEHWSKATLQIDVRHAASHARLAQVLQSQEKAEKALTEWEAAVELDDKQPAWKLELARLLIKSGNRDRAKAILEDLVEFSPNLPGLVEAAQELRP